MSGFIDIIFNYQRKLQEKLFKDEALIKSHKKAYDLSFLIFVIFTLFSIKWNFNIHVKNLIFLLICITNLVSCFVSGIKDMCTSISGFLKRALSTTIILGIFVYFILSKYIKDSYVSYAIITVTFTLIWSFLSTLSNAKIGTISNAIFAVIVGIILQANSFIWSVLELDEFDISFGVSNYKKDFRPYELIELSINTALFPFFVMVTIGALACAYKEYWIEKYYGGKDIGI